MSLLSGLRGGQALITVPQFQQTIEHADNSKMFQLGLARAQQKQAGTSSTTVKKDKYEAPYLTRASGEALLENAAIESAEANFYDKWFEKYQAEGAGQSKSQWIASHRDEMNKELSEIATRKIALQRRDEAEKANVKTVERVMTDIGSMYSVPSTSDGTKRMFSISRAGHEAAGALSVAEYAAFNSIKHKILKGIPLNENETNFISIIMDIEDKDLDKIKASIQDVNVRPMTGLDYMAYQDETKPFGEPVNTRGIQTEAVRNNVKSEAQKIMNEISPILRDNPNITNEVLESIELGFGGSYKQVKTKRLSPTDKMSVNAINTKLNEYFASLKTDASMRDYWESEYLNSISSNQMYEVGKDKDGNPVYAPVSDLSLEQFIANGIIKHVKYVDEVTVNSMTGVGASQREKEQGSWMHQFRYGNLPSENIRFEQESWNSKTLKDKSMTSFVTGLFSEAEAQIMKAIEETQEYKNANEEQRLKIIKDTRERYLKDFAKRIYNKGVSEGRIELTPDMWSSLLISTTSILGIKSANNYLKKQLAEKRQIRMDEIIDNFTPEEIETLVSAPVYEMTPATEKSITYNHNKGGIRADKIFKILGEEFTAADFGAPVGTNKNLRVVSGVDFYGIDDTNYDVITGEFRIEKPMKDVKSIIKDKLGRVGYKNIEDNFYIREETVGQGENKKTYTIVEAATVWDATDKHNDYLFEDASKQSFYTPSRRIHSEKSDEDRYNKISEEAFDIHE